jgi:hypothetical protein
MAILSADPNPGRASDCGRDKRERWTYRNVHAPGRPRGISDFSKLGEKGEVAVHLPVANDELATDVHEDRFSLEDGRD